MRYKKFCAGDERCRHAFLRTGDFYDGLRANWTFDSSWRAIDNSSRPRRRRSISSSNSSNSNGSLLALTPRDGWLWWLPSGLGWSGLGDGGVGLA